MRRVILESPFRGDVKNNLRYARRCLLDSLRRGEAPIASHLLYTQVLDDDKMPDRLLGIEAGLAWIDAAEVAIFYVDRGMSDGMRSALDRYLAAGKDVELRRIYRRGKAELPNQAPLPDLGSQGPQPVPGVYGPKIGDVPG